MVQTRSAGKKHDADQTTLGQKIERQPKKAKVTKKKHTHEKASKGKRKAKEEEEEEEEPDKEEKEEKPSVSKHEASAGTKPKDKESSSQTLEKGLVYFFFRPKIDVETPHDADADIQRSYIVLRPIGKNEKLGDSARDAENDKTRIIEIPKKKLPATGRHDRFLTFVPKGCAGMVLKEVRERLCEDVNETKTKGTRVTPAARPEGEGVYSIVHDGSTTHFAYMLTVPSEPAKAFNIRSQGSFVVSVKNPETKQPPQARGLPQAEYPKEVIEKFRQRSWAPLEPEFMSYDHAQILFIGEKGDVADELDKAEMEEIEKLEEEDEKRMKHLGEEDGVFKDLKLTKDEFPEDALEGTWVQSSQGQVMDV
ncbi:hypothetical protein G7K_2333-t2 [Saitoella complicata NRRL Y-17804]|uniref:Uncharacterized protein n=1 Tax=Saitoella complicata (strain BCRC 22490 / CBS 7301 / JCM 7358 / NBRC 10748 / NRRL Y-17804) TaxID=698492 RepID=A0A0E9NE69_SAICN|nr:hypothetical protein G7K_2333-t2 [Saitoella complicata NRRL Y-17804]